MDNSIREQERAEEAHAESELRDRKLFENMLEGFAYCRMIYDEKGRPTDFIYLNVNPAFDRIAGTRTVVGKPVTEVFPGIKEAYPDLFETYGRVAKTGTPASFDIDFKPSGKWLHISVYSPAKEHFVAVFEDITERKNAEEMLKGQYALFDSILESRDTPIFSVDTKYRYTSFNKSHAMIMKALYGADIGIGKNLLDCQTVPVDRETAKKNIDRAMNGESFAAYAFSGEELLSRRYFEVFHNPVKDPQGSITGAVVFAFDITERKRAEEALKESELQFRTMADWTYDWEYWVDPHRKFVYISPSVERITGYRREEFMADPDLIDRIVHQDDRRLWDAHVLLHITTNDTGPAEIEFRIKHRDGTSRWISHICRPICFDDGTCIGRRVSNRDITDNKMMESEIRSLNKALEQRVEQRTAQLNVSLRDKEVLLREVHHRVKNNLQIIISLLNLQSRYIEDEKTRQVIHESQNRIRAMALVHEKLYQSADIAKIDLDNYIRFLGDSLFQFYGMKGKGIMLNTEIQDIDVDINTAIPVGLIVNELVSNSLKHAFPDRRRGEISIVIKRENAMLTLVYKDTGIGIPSDFDWRNAKSLGLRLVVSLVEQLSGTIELDRIAGTAFTIVVKENG